MNVESLYLNHATRRWNVTIFFIVTLSFMQHIFVSPPQAWQFDESTFLKALHSYSKVRSGLNLMSRQLIRQIPNNAGHLLYPLSYTLNAHSLEHILDRHYDPVKKFPGKSKFIIPIPQINQQIRSAFLAPTFKLPQPHYHYQRIRDCGFLIGFDHLNRPCTHVRVITDRNGLILTAHPIHHLNVPIDE
ncbi:MAG: hypothetical protein ACTHMC_22260 [Pseudobacter sp.]|uniref:hypothetical protein n=1 Tax=Pseudobacter sp. TaxID=2045420 RepID=UPI003F811FCA